MLNNLNVQYKKTYSQFAYLCTVFLCLDLKSNCEFKFKKRTIKGRENIKVEETQDRPQKKKKPNEKNKT